MNLYCNSDFWNLAQSAPASYDKIKRHKPQMISLFRKFSFWYVRNPRLNALWKPLSYLFALCVVAVFQIPMYWYFTLLFLVMPILYAKFIWKFHFICSSVFIGTLVSHPSIVLNLKHVINSRNKDAFFFMVAGYKRFES